MEMKAWGKDPIITAGNWSEDNNGSFMDYETTRSMDCAARVRSRSAEASPCPLICWSIGTEAHVDAATGWRVNHGLYPAREEEWAGGDTFANLPRDGSLRRPRDIFFFVG